MKGKRIIDNTLLTLALVGAGKIADAQIRPILNIEGGPGIYSKTPEGLTFSAGLNSGLKIKNWNLGVQGGIFLPIDYRTNLKRLDQKISYIPTEKGRDLITDRYITSLIDRDLFHYGAFAGFKNFNIEAGLKVDQNKKVTTYEKFKNHTQIEIKKDIQRKLNANPYVGINFSFDVLDTKWSNGKSKSFVKNMNQTSIGFRAYNVTNPKNLELAFVAKYNLIKPRKRNSKNF